MHTLYKLSYIKVYLQNFPKEIQKELICAYVVHHIYLTRSMIATI